MFNFISWESFLTILVVAITGYYLITALAFYRSEIINWIKSLSRPTPQQDTSSISQPFSTMMGTAKQAQQELIIRASSISAEELVAPSEFESSDMIQSSQPKDDLLIGTVADLLEEIKTLIQLIAEYRTGKTESEALFNALFIRYPHLQNTTYPQAVSFYISDAAKGKFSFELTADEVMSWWGFSKTISSNNQPISL